MIDDNKLAEDESRRLDQHEAVKDRVGTDVRSEIASRAEVETPTDRARAGEAAGSMKDKAYGEVADTEAEIGRSRAAARVSQVIDYLFYLVYGIIGIEIILELLGARDSAGFKRFMDAVSAPFLAPFTGLMRDFSSGPFRVMLSYVVALIVYLLLHLAVNGFLRMLAHRKVAV